MLIFCLEWHGMVKFGAVNCAQQDSCSNFHVVGTPTIRVFPPKTQPNNIGLVVEANMDIKYWHSTVLNYVEASQVNGLLPKPLHANLVSVG